MKKKGKGTDSTRQHWCGYLRTRYWRCFRSLKLVSTGTSSRKLLTLGKKQSWEEDEFFNESFSHTRESPQRVWVEGFLYGTRNRIEWFLGATTTTTTRKTLDNERERILILGLPNGAIRQDEGILTRNYADVAGYCVVSDIDPLNIVNPERIPRSSFV